MARPFSYPQVTGLIVGGFTHVSGSVSEVKRKVALYGARNRKRFAVEAESASIAGLDKATRVTRLPDPRP